MAVAILSSTVALILTSVVAGSFAILEAIVALILSSRSVIAAVNSAILEATAALIVSSMCLLNTLILLNEHLQGATVQVPSPWTTAMKTAKKGTAIIAVMVAMTVIMQVN